MAEIKLVRVDYRLIHGQVVARWLKVCPVRRIVLVDDVLGSDEFMSDIYKMAVPKGTDVDIVTIDKAKEVLDNTDDTVFLISKDIETCLKLVEKGVELPAINVGAVPNEEGRKLITTGVAISQKELDMLEELNSKGIEITVQPMPEISAICFDAVKRKMYHKEEKYMNTVIIAIVMGIMYWWCRGMILSYFGFLFISSPVTVGLVAGLLMGQPMQGLIIGGGIALVFAGIFAPGANLPTDECLAATCVIPIAIGSGMNATTAIALAVPVGLLGSFVTNLRKVINTYFVAKANKYAEEGNADAIWRCATIYPALLAIPLLFLPVFIINMVGQDVVINIMKALPTFVTHGLEVAGGVLPALGFALIMNMIGKNKLIPFVFLGYIVVSVGGVNSLTAGIIAICIAFITVFQRQEIAEEVREHE